MSVLLTQRKLAASFEENCTIVTYVLDAALAGLKYDNEEDAYIALTTQLKASVTNGNYTKALNKFGTVFTAPQLKYVTAGYVSTNEDVPTMSPTFSAEPSVIPSPNPTSSSPTFMPFEVPTLEPSMPAGSPTPVPSLLPTPKPKIPTFKPTKAIPVSMYCIQGIEGLNTTEYSADEEQNSLTMKQSVAISLGNASNINSSLI
jgi:hypothetical protein